MKRKWRWKIAPVVYFIQCQEASNNQYTTDNIIQLKSSTVNSYCVITHDVPGLSTEQLGQSVQIFWFISRIRMEVGRGRETSWSLWPLQLSVICQVKHLGLTGLQNSQVPQGLGLSKERVPPCWGQPGCFMARNYRQGGIRWAWFKRIAWEFRTSLLCSDICCSRKHKGLQIRC